MLVIDGLRNILPKINLNSSSIENLVSSYKLVFFQVRRNDIEWRMKLPMFVPPFYDFVIRYNTIPTQEKYYSYYIYQNQSFFKKKTYQMNKLKVLRLGFLEHILL